MKKLITILFTLLLTASLTGCSPQKEDASAPLNEEAQTALEGKMQDCICTKIYMPVCGEDNQTYSNSCVADCAEVKFTMGACGEGF